VVLNKNQKESLKGKFNIQGKSTYETYESFGFNSKSAQITPGKKGKVDKNQFEISLEPLSATLFVCR